MIKTGQKAMGMWKYAVIDSKTGEVVKERKDWGHNLILNRGMQEVGVRLWVNTFGVGYLGTDGAANSRGSLGTTAECTANGTVTLNGGIFAFSAGTDVGNIIQWDSGQEGLIDSITNGTHAHIVPPPTGGTITPDLFTFYHSNRTSLVTEVGAKRTTNYLTGLPYTGSEINATAGTYWMRRTWDFAPDAAPVTYREFGCGWQINPAVPNSTFARVVIPGGIDIAAGQQLRFTYQLVMAMSPITPTPGDANVVGWPVAPAVTTTGTYQLQLVSMSAVSTAGGQSAFVSSQWCNEPMNTFQTVMWMTNSNAALAAFNAAPPARENLAFTDKFGGVTNALLNTVGLNGYVYKTFTWAASANNHTDHRSFGLGNLPLGSSSPPTFAAWTFVLDENQTKGPTQTLQLATLHEWSRALIPDETP